MRDKIFITTSSRADYSPLKNLITIFEKDKKFNTFLIVMGQHLNKNSGNTINEIIKNHKVKIKKIKNKIKRYRELEISFSISQIIKDFSFLLNKLKPKLIIVLGDRYEIMSCAIAAVQFRVPIAHIHGGETTKGSLDNIYRDSISKLSHIHFVSHDKYKKKLIKIGEDPKLIFNYGSPSIEKIYNHILVKINNSISQFIKSRNTYIVTYHPNTLDPNQTNRELDVLLSAIAKLKNFNFIFTYPNLDIFHSSVVEKINEFIKDRSNMMIVKSFGKEKYFSVLSSIAGMIGNSSSAIYESSSFKIPALNIGSRQEGRIITPNIINCNFSRDSIIKGIMRMSSISFFKKIYKIKNPFFRHNTSLNIYKKICSINFNKIIYKKL